ncbi:hypothetical protein BG006_002764 [Podila minutissima]|uniref:Uncharacterized protein n=1 Tax=Podila minutissima TaxID=64525 RepID=A0A9P5SSG5_9FUNG|nr:hypothetical protein BG006_002764 [Podila minutissima]
MFSSQPPSVVCGGAIRGDSLYIADGDSRREPLTSTKYQTNSANPASVADHCSGPSIKSCTSTPILELSYGDHGCEQTCVRKNKILPPPTLSPMLPVTISNPASLNLTAQSPQKPKRTTSSTTMAMASYRRSNRSGSFANTISTTSDHEDEDSDVAHAWPTMDKFFFPDHCCRISACGQKKTQPQNNNKASRQQSVSELPPPLAKRDSSGNPFLTLSASIWGNGWHQVEPLPASFVKTIQRSNLAGYGCEHEGRSHRHRARHQNNNHHQTRGQDCQHNFAKHGYAGHAKQEARHRNNNNGAKAVNADASSWATICSSRLPRSLQFID